MGFHCWAFDFPYLLIVVKNIAVYIKLLVCISLTQRNSRERGLRKRALAESIGLPASISTIAIPMRNASGNTEIVEWPIILPFDFVYQQHW